MRILKLWGTSLRNRGFEFFDYKKSFSAPELEAVIANCKQHTSVNNKAMAHVMSLFLNILRRYLKF